MKLGLEYIADGPYTYAGIKDTFAEDLSFKAALVEALLGDGDFIVHVGEVGDVGHAVAVKSREGTSEFFDPSRMRSLKLPSESLYIGVETHLQSCTIHVAELLQGGAAAGQVDGDSEGSDIFGDQAGGLSKGDKEVAKFGKVKGLALKLKRNASPVAKEVKCGSQTKDVLFTNIDKCLACGGGLCLDSYLISDASVWNGAKWEDVPHGRKRRSLCNRSYKLGYVASGKAHVNTLRNPNDDAIVLVTENLGFRYSYLKQLWSRVRRAHCSLEAEAGTVLLTFPEYVVGNRKSRQARSPVIPAHRVSAPKRLPGPLPRNANMSGVPRRKGRQGRSHVAPAHRAPRARKAARVMQAYRMCCAEKVARAAPT